MQPSAVSCIFTLVFIVLAGKLAEPIVRISACLACTGAFGGVCSFFLWRGAMLVVVVVVVILAPLATASLSCWLQHYLSACYCRSLLLYSLVLLFLLHRLRLLARSFACSIAYFGLPGFCACLFAYSPDSLLACSLTFGIVVFPLCVACASVPQQRVVLCAARRTFVVHR